MRERLIVANMSGFYGDRLSAAEEMVRGGPIDVLTGDYLAELTMAILHRQRMKDPRGGYVKTFLKQMEKVLGECLDRGIRIVANAGGLNPRGLAEDLETLARKLGVAPKIAWIDGDDVLGRIDELRGKGEPLANADTGAGLDDLAAPVVVANAYLGGWGIREALVRGADVVVCPRVTDAALVIGPAAWAFDWRRDDWDALAGALAAGHVLECGAQATGGNYAFFEEVPSYSRVGFPIAEILPDGSFVVTKHPGTGGLVSTGTVTAQLLYEIQGCRYVNPDVVARFDTLEIAEVGPDRVRVSGARGEPPPPTAKLSVQRFGGFRNGMSVVLAGLDIERKAEIVKASLIEAVSSGGAPAVFDFSLVRSDHEDARTNDEAIAQLRVTVMDPDPDKVGRRFSAAVVELALASIPGFTLTAPPGDASPMVIYWPALIDRVHLEEQLHFAGETIAIPAGPMMIGRGAEPLTSPPGPADGGPTVRVALGRVYGARSGDKGGNANLGVWAKTDAAYAHLQRWLTVEALKALLPELAPYAVDRAELPKLRALNFVLHRLLGDGAASSTRLDPQAKTLAEFFRARQTDLPSAIVPPSHA